MEEKFDWSAVRNYEAMESYVFYFLTPKFKTFAAHQSPNFVLSYLNSLEKEIMYGDFLTTEQKQFLLKKINNLKLLK
jgi:hypothetical protein